MSEIDAEDSIARMRAERRSRYALDEMVEQEKANIAELLGSNVATLGEIPLHGTIKDVFEWIKLAGKVSVNRNANPNITVLFALFDTFNDPEIRFKFYEALCKALAGAFISGNLESSVIDGFKNQSKSALASKHKSYHLRRAKMRPFLDAYLASIANAQPKISKIYAHLFKDQKFREAVGDANERIIKKDLREMLQGAAALPTESEIEAATATN